jgi:AcrR family transcriptional regulator
MAKDLFDEPEAEGGGGRGIGGRQKLISAALQLASTTRSLASLGLREVTRYAGLNPNTFYRHFKNFDELGLAAIEQLGGELRRGLRERRRRPARGRRAAPQKDARAMLGDGEKIVAESIALVLDFVTEHRAAYVVGIRELHGTSAAMRLALTRLLDEIAVDMAEDIEYLLPIPSLEPAARLDISRAVIRQMTFFSMDYLEHPQQRETIRAQAERFVMRLFVGELALSAPHLLAEAAARGLPDRKK